MKKIKVEISREDLKNKAFTNRKIISSKTEDGEANFQELIASLLKKHCN